jgi:hypothetical protein
MEFLQIKNKSQYQKNKLIDFFYCLQTIKLLVNNFFDTHF